MATYSAVKIEALEIEGAREHVTRARRHLAELLALAGMSVGALAVHGYHPGVEDAEIYLPGILKLLRPSLYPHNAEFFQSHAGMTLFPHVIAASIKLTHLPVEWALLGWQLLSIFVLLLACRRIAELCFRENYAAWSAVTMVACLLTLPVAGTALYIEDQYVTSRSLSTPAALMAVACTFGGNYVAAALWIAFMAAVHPLMAFFATSYLAVFLVMRHGRRLWRWRLEGFAAVLFPPLSPAYEAVLRTRPYFLITNWAWYEWVGILAPFGVLAWMSRVAQRYRLGPMRAACRALIVFEGVFFALSLVISVPGRFEYLSEIQPLRCLHLLYILLFLFGGGLVGKFLLRDRVWRWAIVILPLCAGMWLTQRDLFAASQHLELPWTAPRNAWAQAFDWVRHNTPENAYFALDPESHRLPGEDEHGFRAMAQRSMLADDGKDSGAVSMFPALAAEWSEQMNAELGWENFKLADFERLKRRYGVDWVVVAQPGVPGLTCPFQNRRLLVCRIE